ncbi:ABC transporter permease [Polymorphospora rubra]|uniref:ABC transporter permease n=1 Tax=Polymorphospora rubra TaxID=338584 RepID=A0A810MZD8_9ACTN|nr:ABC transporter permease [Polymorphospora rubra]BCJ64933.1 ABC transporter permease [Polymorphospora rubra]
MTAGDLLRTAMVGLLGRPLRSALAMLGVALGIAALTGLTGVAASNRAALLAELDRMGADLIVVEPGAGPDGTTVPLPETAPAMIRRMAGVDRVGVVEQVPEGLRVYRTDLVPPGEHNGLGVIAARTDLLDAIGTGLRAGSWFAPGARPLPVTVLGATAADRLGVHDVGGRVWIGGSWYAVVGILNPVPLAGGVDAAAILPADWARAHLPPPADPDRTIAAVYVRGGDGDATAVRPLLAATVDPGGGRASVSALSELADARGATDATLTTLSLALTGIALLVGGVGIANTMVVSVVERRGEIGLRRALGAMPRHIATQFLVEALTLGAAGGIAGAAVGVAAAAVLALATGAPAVVEPLALVGGPLLSSTVGGLAGLHAATRAARMPATDALRVG